MKSIKFRKIIQKINKITRKRQNKKYKGASQKTKSVKMSSSRKKTKTKTKTKKYYHKGGEPTEQEKKDFYSKIVGYIKSENYIELIGMLSEETNVDLFNLKIQEEGSKSEYPLLFYLMDKLPHTNSDSNELIKHVINIFHEKNADMNMTSSTIENDSTKQVRLNENILHHEVMYLGRSVFIDLLIEKGVDPNGSVSLTQTDGGKIIESLNAPVLTYCCRALCIMLASRDRHTDEQVSKVLKCLYTLLNNSKVDINYKGKSSSNKTFYSTIDITPIHFTILWKQFDIFKMFLNNNRLDPNVEIVDRNLLSRAQSLGEDLNYNVNIINYCINKRLLNFARELVENDKFNINIETTDPTNQLYYYSPLTQIIINIHQIIKWEFNFPSNNSETLEIGELDFLTFCSEYSHKVNVNYRPNENYNTPLMIAISNTNEFKNNPKMLDWSIQVIVALFKFDNIDISLKNKETGVDALQLTYHLKNEDLFKKILTSQVDLYIKELEKLETNDQLQKFDHLISDFKNYILSKIPMLNNNLEALESNSRYKEKYGVFITGMREMLVESIKISNTRKLGEEDLLEYINGPPQVTTEQSNKKKKKKKSSVKSINETISYEKIATELPTASTTLPVSLPPHIQTEIEQKIYDLPVIDEDSVGKQIIQKQTMQKEMKEQKKKEKQLLKQKCAEIDPYWLNVIVNTELIKEKEPLNITIYQYFDTFKNIVNELIRNEQFETFKTSMKELIPNFSVTAQSQYLYPNYINQMSAFGVVVTFLSYILYQSQTCILYFKGGRSIQMYMENESNDFDFLILPYYNVDDNSSIPIEYTDAYSANPIVANKHREIALEIGKFILWIFKDTPQIQFSILESPQTSSQNSIVKVSLITRPFPNSDRVHYIPFSDIGYGFEYYDNKIKRLFLSNVYGVNHTKMKIDTLMFSDSLSISFGLGVVFPSLKKLLYERLYYLYLYSYSKQESSSSASAADMYYVNKKLIPQLIKLLNKISVEDPTFKSKLNNFIINNIVSSKNTADKNDEYVRYVNDIFDNPTKYLGK